MERHFKLLGQEVKDKVTGFQGIVETLSFDLYGCVQVVIKPKVSTDGKNMDGRWFDISRLDILNETPVMKKPDFNLGYPELKTDHSEHISSGNKGCSEKPL